MVFLDNCLWKEFLHLQAQSSYLEGSKLNEEPNNHLPALNPSSLMSLELSFLNTVSSHFDGFGRYDYRKYVGHHLYEILFRANGVLQSLVDVDFDASLHFILFRATASCDLLRLSQIGPNSLEIEI